MKEKVLNKLQELNITYKEVEHTPVYTIEDMDNLGNVFENAKICKNLFVRDQKGKRHFLVVLPEEKRAPLADIATKIGSTKLSFASEERLMKYLKLTPGSVTPLAVINDESNEVEVVFDEDLKNAYFLKERYREFNLTADYETCDEELELLIDEFLNSKHEEFRTFGKLLIHWKNEIKNSFIRYQGKRLSNGPIEGANSRIKTILKSANGYTNFNRLRNRIMYSLNKDIPIKGNPKRK